MPAGLKFFSRDPNDKGRGKGVYYHRGNGIYSKYDHKRDEKIKAKGWKVHKIGLPKGTRIPHAGDGRLPR